MTKNNKSTYSRYYYRRIDVVVPETRCRKLGIPQRECARGHQPDRFGYAEKPQIIDINEFRIAHDDNYLGSNGKRSGRDRALFSGRISYMLAGCLFLIIFCGYLALFAFKSNVMAEQPDIKGAISSQPSEKIIQSSEKQPAASLYKYADDEPKSIRIARINVDNAILPIGLDKDNTLLAPEDVHTAGWYNQSSKPGLPGAVLIDGHGSESGTYDGIFSRLHELEINDLIIISRGDGSLLYYTVAKVEIKLINEVDMAETLKPYGGAEEGLNIISCTGHWIKNHSTLDKRIILFAVRSN